jgi:hypothetical protein
MRADDATSRGRCMASSMPRTLVVVNVRWRTGLSAAEALMYEVLNEVFGGRPRRLGSAHDAAAAPNRHGLSERAADPRQPTGRGPSR